MFAGTKVRGFNKFLGNDMIDFERITSKQFKIILINFVQIHEYQCWRILSFFFFFVMTL